MIELINYFQKVDLVELITRNYKFRPGIYIYVNPLNGMFRYVQREEKNLVENNYNKYEVQIDYLSQVISTNKAVDTKKIILSNNYLSFIIKGENIKKLSNELIDGYYSKITDNIVAGKSYQQLVTYSNKQCGNVDIEKLNYIKNWIKDNISQFNDVKGYISIYFTTDLYYYEIEEKRYLYRYIFLNKVDVVERNGVLYGVLNNNNTLNDKKPYLRHLSRKTSVPMLYNFENCLLIKRVFDFFQVAYFQGYRYIYLNELNIIHMFKEGLAPEQTINGHLIVLGAGKNEVKIIDSSWINYNPFNI